MGKRAKKCEDERSKAKVSKVAAELAASGSARPVMDKAEVSKMLGALKYSINAKGKSPEEQQDAANALSTYQQLEANKKGIILGIASEEQG